MRYDQHARCTSRDGDELALKGMTAHGRVVGRMLDMTLEQTYCNTEQRNIEIVYTFPLPHGAVLLGIAVVLNGETLHGQVSAKAAAREQYEDALTEGHTALLLTVQPNGTHTLELGNLLAHETAVVKLHYAQVLQPEQGSLRLTLPTTLAPRYGDPVLQGGYDPHAVPGTSTTAEYPFDLVMRIEGELAMSRIGSPSHPIQLQTLPGTGHCADKDARAGTHTDSAVAQEVRLARAGWLDRDFILKFDNLVHPSQGLAARDRLEDRLESGTGVIMASFTPGWASPEAPPIALKVLVDCSGSMNGDSIQAARRALHQVVDGLSDADRFSLSRFGSHVEHRNKALWKVQPRTLAAAHRWVEQLESDLGGTEMAAALASTLALSTKTPADLLLVTDGEVEAVDEVIATATASGQRVFVVGIGSSPAEHLLRRLAGETGGSCEFVAPGEAVEPAILRLYHRMRSSLVNEVNVVWPAGLEVVNQTDTPKAIFQGDSFNVYARVKASNPDQLCQPITLFGRVSGEAEPRQLAQARPAFIADEANTLARLAAHTRYSQLRQATDAPAFLTRALPELAEKYQLVTDDTSFVLVKERAAGQQATDMPELRQVKHMQAAGWGGLGSVLSVQDNVSVPSVWRSSPSKRSGVSQARFSKASTLGVVDTRLFGSLRHHIPAFLRRQADHADSHDDIGYDLGSDTKEPPRSDANWVEATVDESTGLVGYSGWTPAGYAEWLRRHTGQWPTTYAALRATELGELVVQWLEFVIGEGEDETVVVNAFNRVMAELGQSYLAALGEQLVSTIGLGKQPTGSDMPVGSDAIAERIRADLADITPQSWPVGVLHFAEESDV
jgi:Ca-activated chloride channel family protein